MSVNSKKKMECIKEDYRYRGFQYGIYCIVVAVTVFANMIATTVTSKVSSATIDMTSTALFSISNDTKKMLKKLDSDITIYVMAPKTSADSTIRKLLKGISLRQNILKLNIRIQLYIQISIRNILMQHLHQTV